MKPENEVIAYVEGRAKLKGLHDKAIEDPALRDLLEREDDIPPYTKSGNLFLYLMDQDPTNPAADVAMKDALSKMLGKMGVQHSPDMSAIENFELMLDATPAWLTLPDFYIELLQRETSSLLGRKDKLKAAKDRVKSDFRYLRKPPIWIQSAEWQYDDKRPLIFVGQLDLGDLMHDRGQVYIFFDEKNGAFRTIAQRM